MMLADSPETSAALGSNLIIYGPLGNGKTALMEWALKEA